jgi:ABC-type dipeptide/oligopeptide/nickel transport system ATPase component
MRDGRIVEHGHVQRIITAPEHPYTRELLAAARRTALPDDRASPGTGTGTWART